MFLSYSWKCVCRAAKPSWNSANSLCGVLIGLFLTVVMPFKIFKIESSWHKCLNGCASAVTYTMIAWVAITLLRAIFDSPYQLYKEANKQLVDVSAKLENQKQTSKRNTIADPLKIICGEGDEFHTTEKNGNYIWHKVSAAIENVGNGVVSNCIASLKADPALEGVESPYGLGQSVHFDVMPGVPKFILVADYLQPTPASSDISERLRLCVTQGGGFYDEKPHKLSLTHRHLITIEIKSFDKVICTALYNLFVESGVLRLEKVG